MFLNNSSLAAVLISLTLFVLSAFFRVTPCLIRVNNSLWLSPSNGDTKVGLCARLGGKGAGGTAGPGDDDGS